MYKNDEDNNIEMVELLIKHGADIYKKINDSKTPLNYAIEANNTEIVELLFKYK